MGRSGVGKKSKKRSGETAPLQQRSQVRHLAVVAVGLGPQDPLPPWPWADLSRTWPESGSAAGGAGRAGRAAFLAGHTLVHGSPLGTRSSAKKRRIGVLAVGITWDPGAVPRQGPGHDHGIVSAKAYAVSSVLVLPMHELSHLLSRSLALSSQLLWSSMVC